METILAAPTHPAFTHTQPIDDSRYITAFVTDLKPELSSEEAALLKTQIVVPPDEAAFVYCFERRKIIFATGFEALLGYPDEEMTLLHYMALTTPRYAGFMHELARESLDYVLNPHPKPKDACCLSIELYKYHQDGTEVPCSSSFELLECYGSTVKKTVARLRHLPDMVRGNVIRYTTYSKCVNELEQRLRYANLGQPFISYREMAQLQSISDRMQPFTKVSMNEEETELVQVLCRRFGALEVKQLLAYAKQNQLIN